MMKEVIRLQIDENINNAESYINKWFVWTDFQEKVAGIIKKYSEELKLEEICIWESYLDMDDGLKKKALSYADGKTVENEEDLKELIEDGIAFSAFKSLGNKSLVEGYLSEYGEALENADIDGFNAFLENYKKGLAAEKAAVEAF